MLFFQNYLTKSKKRSANFAPKTHTQSLEFGYEFHLLGVILNLLWTSFSAPLGSMWALIFLLLVLDHETRVTRRLLFPIVFLRSSHDKHLLIFHWNSTTLFCISLASSTSSKSFNGGMLYASMEAIVWLNSDVFLVSA